jgi:hypothetical protein
MRKLKDGGFGYKRLLSEKQFLQVQRRARQLIKGTNLLSIYVKEQTLVYKTQSAEYEDNGYIYTQRLFLEKASFENIVNAKSFKEIEKLMLDGGLKVSCDCPAFHYWGYKYKAWKMGYGLEKELRRPVIRNPHGQGYVCKHLFLVLQTFPFYAKELASKFGKYWEQEIKK